MSLYLENLNRLKERAEELEAIYESCELCPRRCGVNRHRELGYCKAPSQLVISSWGPHFGEEPPLVGLGGSGTIFFTYCNLLCVFCQNYEISHLGYGEVCTEAELADIMLALQRRGCHNINLVTPTHYLPGILKALYIAAGKGLSLPVVYNCGGYENPEIIERLEGIIDIYMPDVKFLSTESSRRYMNAPDYPEVVTRAVRIMHSQVGDLVGEGGIAKRGLIIRHLVMPNHLEDSKKVVDFVASLSPNTYFNIMFQYRPLYRAGEYPEIARRPYLWEYEEVVKYALSRGLRRGFGGRETL